MTNSNWDEFTVMWNFMQKYYYNIDLCKYTIKRKQQNAIVKNAQKQNLEINQNIALNSMC